MRLDLPIPLPDRLAELVIAFAVENMDLTCQENSLGRCADMARSFRLFLQAHHHDAGTLVSWSLERHGVAEDQSKMLFSAPVPHRYYHGLDFNSHYAVMVNDFVIDFTARQFGGGAPFPLVWHIDDAPVSEEDHVSPHHNR